MRYIQSSSRKQVAVIIYRKMKVGDLSESKIVFLYCEDDPKIKAGLGRAIHKGTSHRLLGDCVGCGPG